jgi:thymidylate synthase
MFERTLKFGSPVKPRNSLIYEIGDLQLTVHPSFPFMLFKERNYPLSYFRKEMAWKLSANKYDDSIKKHAKMWNSVQNPDGTFNSNYGQFWFGEQQGFWTALQELIRDKDSRRAVIPMLSKDHLKPETIDTVCTESVGFRIRDNVLVCSVHMRSSDQIFGLGTDIPTFSFLMMLMHGMLKSVYPSLHLGTIVITAMSSHIYEQHFDMVRRIIEAPLQEFRQVEMPTCNTAEAMCIIASRGKPITTGGQLGDWLYDQ